MDKYPEMKTYNLAIDNTLIHSSATIRKFLEKELAITRIGKACDILYLRGYMGFISFSEMFWHCIILHADKIVHIIPSLSLSENLLLRVFLDLSLYDTSSP
ncbi:hypothetical protein PHYBLDRAFT_71543 [Phycomyces blakesleeanus NRRL 1555(-)]|uniref:Tc1-like transposase DDE domain-containing protein n=1 Tax=Phycomyces blakesleeanus (strain ATCC 8743b / DSM 1359 / FGSC 10004 / NBRC 33097 / NRRL 1555) TaxID=763407 RepID=A0A162PLQ5_PHYB8|nr:hypothetical protein PHYBLDRAFT_71543 [Phycomyces blakesleeanus NRRL 1555(-)]OAD70106.1 hypothetical protein PHYBLDRAFT_71543 [Phycomyces blakesleeanus NRRL 1555(-)]|eukprot:XP_018288146.1 hypothetical protein PHYBLDRAFT_71543 [Phycomyces blakesleeanus NRRL 1555(-)]